MDYNWLLTTIAQSSAALVGISSIFLILRIQIFYGDKRALLDFIKELCEKMNTIQSEYWDKYGTKILSKLEYSQEEEKQFKMDTENKDFKIRQINNLMCHFLRFKKPKLPWRVVIGFIGILWLLIFGLMEPVKKLSEFTINYSDIQFIKLFFFIGLYILIGYLIVELECTAFPEFNQKVKNRIIKLFKKKKDKPKTEEQK